MKINLLYIAIILLLFLIFIVKIKKPYENYENYDNDFKKIIDTHEFYDESGKKIDHKKEEISEQYQAYKFIEKEDIVLELGARYGTVSVLINKLVNNKTQHVVVEPDESIIPALEQNIKKHNASCTVLPKIISNKNKKVVQDGYATYITDSETKANNQISYSEFKQLFPQKFNVIVADCEGCLGEFIEMMGNDFNNIDKFIFEEDKKDVCDYEKIKEKLINNGFEEVDKDFNIVNRYVFKKPFKKPTVS